MQKLTLIGRVGNDPELRSTPSGVTVCSFSVAVSSQKKEQTTWYRINAWRQLGEVCARYLSKGKLVAVAGELETRPYTAKDGTTRMSLDVQADAVEFLSPRTEKHDEPKEDAVMQGFTDITSEDIPF